jgi:hypothetical protein
LNGLFCKAFKVTFEREGQPGPFLEGQVHSVYTFSDLSRFHTAA